MSKIRQIDPKISKKCLNYCKNPTHDKKRGTWPQNPTAGSQTYWTPRAYVPQQFPALCNYVPTAMMQTIILK